MICRALYGGKLSGRDFSTNLHSCMNFLEFQSFQADPDIWICEAHNLEGGEYWEYFILYVDNCLVVSYCGEELLRNEIGKYFELKEKSIGTPDQYLGVKMHQVVLDNGTTDWDSRSI